MDPVAGPSRIPHRSGCAKPPRVPRSRGVDDDHYHRGHSGDGAGVNGPQESFVSNDDLDAGPSYRTLQQPTRSSPSSSLSYERPRRQHSSTRSMKADNPRRAGLVITSIGSYLLVASHLYEGAAAAPSSPLWDSKGKGRAYDFDEQRGVSDKLNRRLSSGNLMRADTLLPPATPSRTTSTPTLSRLGKRQVGAAAAYSSGIIADWTHQSRSVWFQRKAIIITSCFLAIFIVLIIGATVFLRDRRDENDVDEEDDDEYSDEAALRRMREERKMRSGDRAKKKEKKRSEKEAREKEENGSMQRKGRRKADGTSSGSSTALSKRLVSRWIRSSPGMERIGSATSSSQAANEAGASRRSTESSRSSLRRAASRGSRLGGPRQDRVEVEYDDGTAAEPVSSRETGQSASGSSSGPRHSTSRPSSSNRQADHSAALDESDIQAADEAVDINQPPAYIHPPSASSPPPPPPPPMPAPTSQPTYHRPLAGEFTGGDSKEGATGGASSTSPQVPAHVLANLQRQDNAVTTTGPSQALTAEDGIAHLATDDKARLAALAAAASSPTSVPSAPQYEGGSTSASAPQTIQAPSAPDLGDDHDGDSIFEALPPQPSAADLEHRGYPNEKGKGKSKGEQNVSADFLPAPPSAHRQHYSPFDQPYHRATLREPPTLSRSGSATSVPRSPAGVPAAEPSAPPADVDEGTNPTSEPPALSSRAAEKQREAEAELALVASSPAEYAARDGHGSGGSAPEALPVYQRGENAQQPSAPALGADAEQEAPTDVRASAPPFAPHERPHPSAPPAEDN